jgi:hypothetical protein
VPERTATCEEFCIKAAQIDSFPQKLWKSITTINRISPVWRNLRLSGVPAAAYRQPRLDERLPARLGLL